MVNSTNFKHGTASSYARHKCRCEQCTNAYVSYHAAYRARTIDIRQARDRALHALNRDRDNAARRARYKANAEQERINASRRYRENIESRRAKQAEWGQRNKPLRQAARARRKALKRSAGIFVVTARDWSRLCARFDHRCAYCGERKPLTQDHVVAIVRGGKHSIGNLVPCCVSCNASKGPKLLTEWRLWQSKMT